MKSISDPRKPPRKPPKRNKIRDPSLIPIIPEELIIEILSRLPAKSLGKFKCVSRSWLSLISSRGFIKAHLATASGRDDYGHHGLIFTEHSSQPNRYNQLKQSSVCSLLYAPATAEAVDIDYPMKRANRSFWVVGSCDGLVCIRTRMDDLFLWNPCTKESKKLPYAGIRNDWVRLGYGFGYDELNDDYKVAALFFIVSGETFETKANVYSLKNNCWHLTEDFKIGDQMIGLGQYVSGKLHWFVSDGIDSRKIGSLDLANETYEEMDNPNHGDYQYNWTLGVLGGCLSVLYYETTHADVWVMKDYGVKESWTKVVSIPYIGNPGQMFCSFDLVCMSRTGEILFVLQSVLSLYNSKSNTFMRYPQINPLLDVNMYVESLVSPGARDGEQRQLRLRGKRKVPRS